MMPKEERIRPAGIPAKERSQRSELGEVDPAPEPFRPAKPPRIDGVAVRELKAIVDERGHLMEILRSDWPEYDGFGQVYVTTANPGVTKGWHYHALQVDHFACLSGRMKLVLYDGRKGSKTFGVVNEFVLGDNAPYLVRIPAGVYHGFKCISHIPCVVLNVPNHLYNYGSPDEYRLPAHTEKIPYDWSVKDG